MYNDENASQTIAEMAAARTTPATPAIGETRLNAMDRIATTANQPGGIGILNGTDQENAEKTSRWAIQDAAAKMKNANNGRGDPRAPNVIGAAMAQHVKTFGTDTPSFADGGKPETAEELLARISGKYNVSNASQSAPAPAPVVQPTPAPQQQPKPQGGLIQQAVGIFSNRKAQIDKAVGYANGGKPSRKISGPGTATSDSIPAVAGSGQPIRVANGERILSVDQDAALERIAEMLGYDSVDALLAAVTGKPVGPTLKGGIPAAADGAKVGDPEAQTSLAPLNGQATRAGAYPSKLEQALTGAPVVAGASNINRGDVGPSVISQQVKRDFQSLSGPEKPVAYGNEGRSVPNPITDQSGHPISVPASRPGAAIMQAASPIDSAPATQLTTTDLVPGGYSDRGQGIMAQRGANGRLNVTNTGTEGFTDPNTQVADSSAGALRDQQSNNAYWSPAAQLDRMQRRRLLSDATDPSITDPGVKADAIKGLGILNAARTGEAQLTAQAAQTKLHTAQAANADQMLSLQRELLDPATTPERRKVVRDTFAALHGQQEKPAALQAIDVEEPIDPKQPLLGNKKIPYVFDPRTGQSRPMLQSQQPPTYSQADLEHTAKKYGMTIEQVKAKLAGAK